MPSDPLIQLLRDERDAAASLSHLSHHYHASHGDGEMYDDGAVTTDACIYPQPPLQGNCVELGGTPVHTGPTLEQMDALIVVAKCHNKAKVRALLTTHIDGTIFWRAGYQQYGHRLHVITQKHWELYEALAFNNTVADVIATLQQSKTGGKRYYYSPSNYYSPNKPHRIPGFQEYPHKGAAHAECMLIKIAQAARGWCCLTDDVTNFARMFGEPLYKGEMELSVREMFFDMPRMGTGKVAEWWLQKHELPYNPLHTPVQVLEGNFKAILWPKGGDYGDLPHGDHDWNGYRHCSPNGYNQDRLGPWPPGRTIFNPPAPRGSPTGPDELSSLYQMGTMTASDGMAPCFNGPYGTAAGRRRYPDKWPCGRKEVHHFMPSFAFWFSLGLPPSLLVREDRMFYHFWQIRQVLRRALFRIKLRKMTERLMPILMAPPEYDEFNVQTTRGGSWYQRDAATSAGAAAYAALPVTL